MITKYLMTVEGVTPSESLFITESEARNAQKSVIDTHKFSQLFFSGINVLEYVDIDQVIVDDNDSIIEFKKMGLNYIDGAKLLK